MRVFEFMYTINIFSFFVRSRRNLQRSWLTDFFFGVVAAMDLPKYGVINKQGGPPSRRLCEILIGKSSSL